MNLKNYFKTSLKKKKKVIPTDINNYWNDRKDHDLYKLTVFIAKAMFPNATSIIDVGSYISPLILDFDWIPRKVATDIQKPLIKNWENVKGVEFIAGDAFKLDFSEKFSIVLSNQTIEHVEDPKEFVKKLMSLGNGLIISTTFELPYGTIPGHIQDPISLEKFQSWFPVPLDSWTICYHPTRKIKHIIGCIKKTF
jgi:hypothetical protein